MPSNYHGLLFSLRTDFNNSKTYGSNLCLYEYTKVFKKSTYLTKHTKLEWLGFERKICKTGHFTS